jgi:capsular polysaccharide export protein
MSRFSRTPAVLFLQGPPSLFWKQLAEAFEASGIRILRVNFSLGDQLYWPKAGAINFRRAIHKWPDFLRDLIRREKITDILYYADQLPYHRMARDVADEFGVMCHAVEFGYLRPDWITLERNGMGRYSHFPVRPEEIRAIAKQVSEPDMTVRYPHTFGQEAFNEVLYNLLAYFGRPLFPLYDADKYYNPVVDYLSWVFRRLGRQPRLLPENYLDDDQPPFFLLALQLQSDYQIRANSTYGHLSALLEEVIGSLAKFAPPETRLIVKQHPLDNGMESWAKLTGRIASAHGVKSRVTFVDSGDLGPMLRKASGAIVVNSTTGLHSLRAGKPTITLGTAIYDIKGLTHQDGLDSFWTNPAAVDMDLLDDFVKTLAGTVQVKGNFYHREGREVAARQMVERILEGRVNQPNAFVEPPPRLIPFLDGLPAEA